MMTPSTFRARWTKGFVPRRSKLGALIVSALTAPVLAPSVWASDSACTDDAMLVLDASGSMVQRGASGQTLMEDARSAARQILPAAARNRKLGLLTLGPGPSDQCSNVQIKVPVQSEAGRPILDAMDKLTTDGGTPLTSAVQAAADALDYRHRPAVVVVVSDGDETCGRDPCDLARSLKEQARDLKIHIIGFKAGQGARTATCMAETTDGLAVAAETTEELETALRQTLMCPQVSLLR